MSFKILSLDGGGSWALVQARVLLDIYGDKRGHEVLREFDLVIANSGGALVLACMCNDMRMSEIVSVFMEESERKQIFSKLNFGEGSFLALVKQIFKKFPIGPKYHGGRKLRGLEKVLEEHDENYKKKLVQTPIVKTPLNKLPAIIGKNELQLLIVGFDYFRERVTFFRSNEKSNTDKFNSKYYEITLGHAIHASSNAPVNYFHEYARLNMKCNGPGGAEDEKTNWFWDGAVAGFNNPVLAGLVEAMTHNNSVPLEDFRILSLGTGISSRAVITDYKYSSNAKNKDIYEKNKASSYVISNDAPKFQLEIGKMAASILSDPPDSATFIAYSILNRNLDENANLVRINPCITPVLNKTTNKYEAPEVFKNNQKKFLDLLNLDMDAVNDDQIKLIEDVCNNFIVKEETTACLPNQYIRGDANTPAKLGFGTYREAKNKWLEIAPPTSKTETMLIGIRSNKESI